MDRNTTTRVAAVLALAWTLAGGASTLAVEHGDIAWTEDQRDAFRRAEAEGKPVLVDVWAVWCAPCKVMESMTFADESVTAAMKHFVALKVDADANEIFAETYDADILPTTLLLDAGGEEIARFTGLVGPEDLVDAMRTVRDGYAEYVDQVGRKRDPIALEAVASFLQGVGNDLRATEVLKRALKMMRNADPADVERIELKLARSHLGTGEAAAAAKILERLSSEGANDTIRGRALQGLVIAQRMRGRDADSDAALERLRHDYPAMAEELEEGS